MTSGRSRTTSVARWLVAAVAAVHLSGCTILPKSTPIEVHYFTPERLEAPGPPPATRVARDGPRLRLGAVGSSAHLRARIVYRESAVELGAYDQQRWTDNPEVYARRSLERALFDRAAMAQAVGGAVPTLDVELLAFEEVRRGNAVSGRVELAYVLHDDRDVLTSGHAVAERLAKTSAIGDVVVAISDALEAATAEIATIVRAELGR